MPRNEAGPERAEQEPMRTLSGVTPGTCSDGAPVMSAGTSIKQNRSILLHPRRTDIIPPSSAHCGTRELLREGYVSALDAESHAAVQCHGSKGDQQGKLTTRGCTCRSCFYHVLHQLLPRPLRTVHHANLARGDIYRIEPDNLSTADLQLKPEPVRAV